MSLQPDGSWRDPNAQMAIDIGQGKVNPNSAGYAAVQAAHQMYGSQAINSTWGFHANAPPPPFGGGSGWGGSTSARQAQPAGQAMGVWAPSQGGRPAVVKSDRPQMSAEDVRTLLGLPPLSAGAQANRVAVPMPDVDRSSRAAGWKRWLLVATLIAGVYAAVLHRVQLAWWLAAAWPMQGYAMLHVADERQFPRFAPAAGLQVDASAPGLASYVVANPTGARIHVLTFVSGRWQAVAADAALPVGRPLTGRPVVQAGRVWLAVPLLRQGRPVGLAHLDMRDLRPEPVPRRVAPRGVAAAAV